MQAVSPLNYFIFYRKSVFLSKKNKQTVLIWTEYQVI